MTIRRLDYQAKTLIVRVASGENYFLTLHFYYLYETSFMFSCLAVAKRLVRDFATDIESRSVVATVLLSFQTYNPDYNEDCF